MRVRTSAPVDPVARLTDQIRSLQQQVAELQRPSAGWESAQPVFTASTTNPALGTGGQLRVGRMKRTRDGLIAFRFSIRFGDSGASAGSGNYFVQAPVDAHLLNGTNADTVIGTVWGFDSSASRWMPFRLQADWSMRVDAGGGIVTHNNPWSWGAGDRLQASLLYEPA